MKTILLRRYAIFAIAGILLLLTLVLTGFYIYNTNIKKEVKVSLSDFDQTLAKVAQILELPPNETPTMATVTDLEKLKDQPFFTKAEVGDKVIIYNAAKKAILYRPSTNKVIEVAPINISSGSAQIQASSSASEQSESEKQIKAVILNGSKKAGVAGAKEKEITSKFPGVSVIEKGNTNADYQRSLIVVQNESLKKEIEEISKTFKINLESMPAGEENYEDADFVIIVGN